MPGSLREPDTRRLGARQSVRKKGGIAPVEIVAVLVVIAAALALAVWFLFFASGGVGPGTV